jgi:hypothetical protein
LINKIAKDSTDLSNPLNLLEEMLTYLNSVDKFIVSDDEVESNEDTLTDELAESNRSINLRISKTSQTISDSFDSVTNSLKSIEQTSAQLQKELAAIESLPKPDLQDLWELRKASGDVNPTETDVYFAQIQSLSESIEKTKEYIANNSSALQSWMSFLRLIPSEKTKPGVEKYLSALEERLLEQFGLTESFEESDFDNIVEYINDVFSKMIGLSPELLNYDKILKGDFSELTEQLDTDFSERLNTIPKLELELKLLKEAYGDIEQIIKTEKDTQTKTGKKEIAELTQKFNTTHAPIQGEPAVIEDNFENLNTDLSNLIIEQNLKPVGALITSAYDVEYKLEDSEVFGIKVKTPVTVFDKEGLPKFTKNRQQRYWSILLNKIAAGSFTDEEGKPFPNPNQLRLRFVLADDKFIKDEFAHSDDVNPSQKEELFKRGLSVDETGKVFIFNRAALAKFAGAYGSYFDAAGATVDLISDSDKALMKSLLEKENGTVDNDKSRLTVQEFDLLFKYRIADTYSKKQGDELVLHFTDEKYENSTFIYGTGMYVTITDAKGTEYYFDLANNKFTTDKAKLKTGDYDKIVTTLVRPSSVKRMQLKNSLATYIYGETFGSPTPISWIDLNKVLSDANIKTVNVKHNGQNYAVSLEEIANLPDSFVIAKEKYDQLSDIQKILFEISEKFVVDNISNEFDGRRSIKQLLRANPDKIFVSKSPIKISQGIPLETQDDTFKNITGKPNSAVTSAEDIEAYLVHTLGNKSQVSSWGESIDALFSGDATIKAGKGKRGRVYLKKKNKTVIEGITRKLNDNEAQLIVDMFATDYSGFVDQDADGPRTMRQIEDESGNKVPGIDAAYLTMWPGNEFAKSMIQKLIFFQRKANDTKKPNAGTFIIDLDNRPEFGNSRKLYIYYGVDGKIALSDLKNPDRNKEAVDKFKDWLKTRPLNLLNNIPQDKPYYHPVAIKKSKSGDPVLVVKKFEPTSDKNKVHPYVSYMFSESNGQTVLQTKIVPDESFYDTQEKLKGKGQQVSNRYVIVENGAISTESAIVADGKIASITPTITPGTGAAPTGVVENTNPNFTKVEEIERTEDLANQKVQIKKKYTVSNDVLFKDMDPNKTYRVVAKDLADDNSNVITEFDVTFKDGFPTITNIVKSEKIVDGKSNDITSAVRDKVNAGKILSIFSVGVFNFIDLNVKDKDLFAKDSNFNNLFDFSIDENGKIKDGLSVKLPNRSIFKVTDTDTYVSKISYEVSYEETIVENLPLTDLQKDQILVKEFEKVLTEINNDDPLALSKTIDKLKDLSAKALTNELKDNINNIIESLNVPAEEANQDFSNWEIGTKLEGTDFTYTVTGFNESRPKLELESKISIEPIHKEILEMLPDYSNVKISLDNDKGGLGYVGDFTERETERAGEIAISTVIKYSGVPSSEIYTHELLHYFTIPALIQYNKGNKANNIVQYVEKLNGLYLRAKEQGYSPINGVSMYDNLNEFAVNITNAESVKKLKEFGLYKDLMNITRNYLSSLVSEPKSTPIVTESTVSIINNKLVDQNTNLAKLLEDIGLRMEIEPILAKIYTSWNTIPVTIDNKLDISAEASEQLSADRKEFKRSIIIGNKFTPEDKKQSSRKIIHEVVHTVTLVKLNSYYRDPSKVSDKIREGVEALIQVRNDYLKALAANPKKIEDNSRVTYLFNYLPSEFGLNNKQYFKAIREALMQWSALYDTDPNTSIDILYDKIIERLKAASPSVSEDVVKKYKESLTNNVTEFISGIFENKDLREDLSKITSPRSGNLVDLLTDLVNALKTYFLSIGDSLNSQEESLLNEAINAAETIIKSDLYKLSDKKTIDPSPEVDTKITGGITPDAFNTLDDEGGNAYYPEDVNITSSEDFDSDLLDLFDLVYSDNYKDNQDLLDEHFNLIKSMFNISNDALYNAKQNLNYFNDSERTSSSDTDVINKLFSLLDSVPVVRNATNGITSVFKLLDEFDAFKDLSIKDKSLLLSERIKEYITFGNSEDLKSVDSLFQDDSPLIEMFRQIKQMNDLFELNNNLVRETYKTLQIPLPTTVKTNIMKYFTPTFVDKNGEEIEDFPDIFTTELLDALDYFVLKGILSDTNLSSTLDLSLSNANIGTIYSEAFKNITAIFDRNIKNILNANNINLADRLNNIQQVKDVIGIYENRSSLIASHMSTRMSQLFPKLDINEMDINDIADLDEYATKENLYEDSDLRDVSQSISGVMKMLLSSVPKKKKLTNKVSLTPEKEKEYTTILNELKKFRESAVLKNLENVDGVSKRFIMNKKGFEGFTVIGSPHKLIKTLIEFIPKNEIETLEILNTLLSSKYNVDEQKGLSRDKNLQVLISSTLDKAINKLDLLISNKIASLSILDDNSLLLSLPQLEDFGRVWNYIARRSSGLPNDYDVFFNSRLNQIVNDEFNKDSRGLYGLTDIQKYISEFADLSDPYNLAIRATASQAFNKYEMINYIITADSTGLISLVDANINRESKDIRSAWESNYLERLRNFNVNITKSISSATNDISDLHDIYERKSYADLIISPFYIQRLKDLVKAAQASKSDTTKAAEYLDEVLSLLGINMSNSARMYSSYKNNSVAGISYGAFMNRLSSFIIALDEAAKVIDPLNPIEDEDNVHQRKFVNIFSNSATAGFINELITYQLNEQNEFITNQFQNAEGKTVYALQLMHSLTNTASTLNYYNSSEETLRENLPHLFNRMSGYVENGKFVSTSLLLSGVLSDAKKNVNIVSLNGARDSDNNSKITATLSPGELLATRIKHITSGVYLINQAADRKVTNGIVMSNNNKNEVFFQNISDGLEQFRKYLLNEMNAMLNDAGDDIIFFKDKRHEFRYFKGILGKVATKAAKELISLKQRNEFITFDELNSYEYTDAETGTVYKLRDLVDESVSKFFSKEVDKLFKQGSKTGIFNSTTTKIVWEKGEAKREHIGKIKKIKTTKNPNGTISFAREKGADQQYHNVEEVVNTFNFPIGIGYELWREYQGKKYWLLDQNKTGDSWDDTIKQILTSVVFNQAAAYVEQSIVFTGDPAIYKNLNDMYKRIAMHNSPKKTIIIGKMVNEALKNNKALVLYKESEDALSSDEVVRELTDDEVKNYIKGKYKVPKDHYLKAESGFRVDRYFSDFIYNPDLIKTVITDDVFAVSDLAFDKVSSIEVVNKKPVYKDADGKKLELNQVSTYRKVFTDMFLNLGITDERELMNKVEAYLDPYLKIEESNAIGLITLSEYRNMFIRSGLDWTKKHELAFVKAISGEVLSSDDMQLFQPIKSQYSGPLHDYLNTEDKTVNGDSRRLNVHTGYKHMLMPLIPSAIKGTYYEKVSNYMNESGVGILQFISGNKYGTKMRIDADSRAHLNEFIPESESKIKSNFESWVDQSIYYKYFGIQVDNKPKLKGEQRVSTQGRKTMTLNSKEFGVAVDPALERLVDSYTDVNNTLTFNNWDDFKKKLGVYFDSKTNSSVISDIEYLIKILLDQEKDRGSNMNTVSSIVAMLENPNMKIENTMSPGKVQNVLMALVRNRVLKDRRKGESFAQVPVSGFDKIFRNRHETGKMNSSKELLFYRQGKDGSTLPAQAMVPYPTDWTPWLLKMGNGDLGKGLDELNKLLDKLHTKLYNIRETDGGETSDLADIDNFVLTAEEENLLNLTTIIGFRIPNQGFSSNEVFEIRKFLPAEHGALVVLPTEIVAKNGSDFDFDKNNTYIPNWRIDKKTGIPTYINPDNFDKAAYGRYISKIKKELSKSDEFVKGRIKDIKQVNSKIKEYFSSQRSILTFANLVESSPELAVYLEIVKASIDILTDAKSNLDTDQIADELEVFTAVMDLIDQFKDVEGLDLSDVASVDLMSDLRSIVTDLTLLVNVTKPELISDFNTYIEANSLPFEEYKRNFKENPLKYSDQQMLENRSIKLHKDILTHPANFGQLISPIDDSVLKGKKLGPKKDYNPGIVWKVRFFKSFNNPDYSKIVEEYKAELASGENRKTSLDKAVDKFINFYSELRR